MSFAKPWRVGTEFLIRFNITHHYFDFFSCVNIYSGNCYYWLLSESCLIPSYHYQISEEMNFLINYNKTLANNNRSHAVPKSSRLLQQEDSPQMQSTFKFQYCALCLYHICKNHCCKLAEIHHWNTLQIYLCAPHNNDDVQLMWFVASRATTRYWTKN